MTTQCSTVRNHNFFCVAKASFKLINLPLIDILTNYVKDVDLFKKIDSCPTLLSGRYKLRSDQLKICYIQPPDIPDYSKFDVTLLYTLIRNLCPFLRPTKGWGIDPQTTDTKLGDDIERLRLFRNNSYAHAVSEAIPDTEFENVWKDLKSVINRIQSNGQTVCSVNYEEKLVEIENSKFTNECWEECKILLGTLLKLETYGRDEPEVVIKGKDEVICGDLARFEAVLKPDSTCWSITWQKRRGKVIEIIDTSQMKYSGSTNRKLVMKSVCKEDEGEYQILLSHESNGNGYLKCGHTICLHVFGELPLLNDLKVTTGDEGIIIHYDYDVPEHSPKVQRIEWSKDGQALDINTYKYCGGSVDDSILTIRLPTEEDKGNYSCKIINAVGSVSKDVMLNVPSVDILANHTVLFGSKATITGVVSSNPSPEQVEWQRSKDGKIFHCLDITKPKYYGSTDTPFKPFLVIPKATFDDKQHYRLLVRNEIGERVSDTLHLKVTGSPPNVAISHKTNTKNKIFKLSVNVSLYDDSPDILEVFWTMNGEKIDTQGSGRRLSEVTIDNPSLIIRDVSVDDAGVYQFTAVNAVGSTTSDDIVLDVPEVFFEETEKMEDGAQMYLVTIQSVPSPFFVQWSSKGRGDDMYTPIDVNDENYKGTLNTIPHPVLAVRKYQLENYNYQIEVANFIGCTVKQILGNQSHQSENKTKENKIYKNRDAGIKFAKLSNYLAKQFPHQELENLKYILRASGKVENVSSLMSAKSALECFTVLHEENIFTQKDVLFMQFLLKETECHELYSQCIRYALTNKALCYFEKKPENGYKNVQFHIQGNLNEYTKEDQQNIVEVVADILDCEMQDIFVNGVKPSNSFFLVLSLKEVYTWKLLKMDEEDRLKLRNLNIDSLIVDKITIYLQDLEDESPIGTTKRKESFFLRSWSSWITNALSSPIGRGKNNKSERDKGEKFQEIRDKTSSDEELECCANRNQTKKTHITNRSVQPLLIPGFYPRFRSKPHLAGSSDVSAEADFCYNPDDRNTVEKDKSIQMRKDAIRIAERRIEQDILDEKRMFSQEEDRTLSDEEPEFYVNRDQSIKTHIMNPERPRPSSRFYSRLRSKPHFAGSSDVSAEADSCYNSNDRNSIEKDNFIQMRKDKTRIEELLLKQFKAQTTLEQDILDEKKMFSQKEDRTLSDEELECYDNRDQSIKTHIMNPAPPRSSSSFYSRLWPLTHFARSSYVSAKADSCYNPDDRISIEKDKSIPERIDAMRIARKCIGEYKLQKPLEQDKLDEKKMSSQKIEHQAANRTQNVEPIET